MSSSFVLSAAPTYYETYLDNIQEKRLIALLLKSKISNILDIEENILLPKQQREAQLQKD